MKKFNLLVLGVIALFAFACTGSTGSGDDPERKEDDQTLSTIKISGNFVSLSTNKSVMQNSTASQYYVWFYSIDNSGVHFLQKSEVGSTGNFSANIEDDKKFVAFLVDESKDYEKSKGVIGVSVGEEEWEALNTEYFDGDINLGDLSGNSDLYESSFDLESNENKSNIENLAKYDNILRSVKNTINLSELGARSRSDVVFGSENKDKFKDNYGEVSDFSFSGYQLVLYRDEKFNSGIKLYPPSDVSWGNGTSYSTISGCDASYENDDQFLEFGYGEDKDNLFQTIPEGNWSLKDNNDNVIAYLDYYISKPVKDDGRSVVPMVSFKVNTENDKIVSFDLKYYLYDGSNYIEMTAEQIEAYKFLITNFRCGLVDFNPNNDNNKRVDADIDLSFGESHIEMTDAIYPDTELLTDGKYDFYYNQSSDKSCDYISFGYELNNLKVSQRLRLDK